jgi:hypothetical protein
LVADVGAVCSVASSPDVMLWGIYGEKSTGVGLARRPSSDASAC